MRIITLALRKSLIPWDVEGLSKYRTLPILSRAFLTM